MKKELTYEEIAALVSYDPETGAFRRLVNRANSPAGSDAATKIVKGHRVVRVGGSEFYAHRLAWLLTYREWPSRQIDHINRDRADNRIVNLRLATNQQNQWNRGLNSKNTSGRKGVHFYKRTGQWQAYIKVHGKRFHLGTFATCEAASIAYRQAARSHFGEFANPG